MLLREYLCNFYCKRGLMKKLGLLLAIFLMSVTACYAANIKVTAINQISTKSPNEIIKVQVVETIQLSESFILKEGTVLEGKMVDVIPPKRLKKNSTFSFIPQKYTVDGKTDRKSTRLNSSHQIISYAVF